MDSRDMPAGAWSAARERSSAVAAAWRDLPALRAMADAFDDRAASDVTIARERAVALLADDGWAARLIAPLVSAMADDPLFEPPFRVNRERGRIGAALFDAPAARVAVSVLSARILNAHPAPSVVVPGHVSVTRYICSGGARIRRWRAAGDGVEEIAPLFPRNGDIIVQDGRDEGQIIAACASDVTTLTVILRAEIAPIMREYRIDDGALIRSASTDDGASRTAMLLTLLRICGRADAAQVFDAATHDSAAHARWGAMREWLALDAAAALPRLGAMAERDPDAEVRGVAQATRALVERRRAACPA